MTPEGISRTETGGTRRIPSSPKTSRKICHHSSSHGETYAFGELYMHLIGHTFMTDRYVTIVPSLSGKGPPATMLTCHPVCCMRELPHVASVRGSLSIALVYVGKSAGFGHSKDDTHAWKSLFRSASSWTDAAGLSSRLFR